jgi:hypothetical protein
MHILIIRLSKIRNLDIAHQRRLSLRQKVLPLSSTKVPPSPPVRSSSFLLSNALNRHSLFGDTSSCNAYQKPKLPIFSGEEKSETSFDVWKLEVKCVLRVGSYTG